MSIVVPIFQVEKYIERCAVSLLEQDLHDIEYLFINDATRDNSINILASVLKRYPHRRQQVRVVHNVQNSGVFESRKKGVMLATGEYILQFDPDDWAELDMVSSLYKKAQSQNADVVICDYFSEWKNKQVHTKNTVSQESKENLIFMFEGRLNIALWCNLIKRERFLDCYDFIGFTGHINLADDWLISLPLHHLCRLPTHLARPLYHYNCCNANSLTKLTDMKKSTQDRKKVLLLLYVSFNAIAHEEEKRVIRDGLALASLRFTTVHNITTDWAFLEKLNYKTGDLWRSHTSLKVKFLFTLVLLGAPGIPRIVLKTYKYLKYKFIYGNTD